MRMFKKFLSFLLVFCITAATVAIAAFAVDTAADDGALSLSDTDSFMSTPDEAVKPSLSTDNEPDLASSSAAQYTPRLTAPAKTNKYYYSDANVFYKYGWGMPNCTCYAWGRAYEILKTAPSLSIYSAHLWYDYNRTNAIYTYGQTPKLGAIACFIYSSGDSGHVAVVEKIENNIITFSNSAYGGENFYLSTAPVTDPTAGRKTWKFQGYIYIGDYQAPPASQDQQAAGGDIYRITSEDGVNLRAGAGTSYTVIGAIPFDKEVTVTKTAKANGYTWGYTTYEGITGWFVTNFAKLVSKGASETPTAAPTEAPTQAPTQAPTVKPTEAPKPQGPLKGDLDGDGKISIVDATMIRKILVHLITPTAYMNQVGDVDSDGSMTIIDATRLQKYLAGLIKTL